MYGLSVGSYVETYEKYRNFMRTFGRCTPKEYGEYLAGKKRKKKKSGGRKR